MTNEAIKKKPKAPASWPPEVLEEFEPIRSLGKGGFGSVMLARRKRNSAASGDKLVAIKVVGSEDPTQMEVGYAHREMDILRELSHPRIMRLIQVWEPPPSVHKCAAVMALSYAKGPTLQYILDKVGAPSPTFGRTVSAQLIDAISYLHSHGVIHRDIKPDNIIITGASLKQDELYEDDTEDDASNKRSPAHWSEVREKWHVTLIDLGFARALGPDDVNKDWGMRNSISGEFPPESSADPDWSLDDSLANSHSSRDRSRRRSSLTSSRHLVREMSALGNRSYAAPEVRNKVKHGDVKDHSGKSRTRQKATLSSNVSEYGMTADAYSTGSTVRYILTGVHPDDKIETVISMQNNPAARAARWLGGKMAKKKANQSEPKSRKKKYRRADQLPAEAVRMIKGMTILNPKERTTVRAARLYPWVDDVLEPSEVSLFRKMQFLKCATRKSFYGEPITVIQEPE